MDRIEEVERGAGPTGFPAVVTEGPMTATATGFSNVFTARVASRSPRIPFPSSYISRTPSEIELSIDKERAKRHQLQLFHQIVRGIRDRQKKLGMVTSLSPSFMETVPYSGTNGESPIALHSIPAVVVTSIKQPSNLPWLQPATTASPVPTVQDDWSISGFEGQTDDGSTTTEPFFALTREEQLPVLAAPTTWGKFYDDHVDQQQEGIFQLDF